MKCLWPVNHISIDTYGYIRPCCAWELWDVKTKPFNINQNKLEDYFKSESYLNLLKSMQSNNFGEGCRDCVDQERKGILGMKDESFEDYEYKENFGIHDMEIKFGNLCNQGCVMCSPTNSSVLEQEKIKNNFHIDNSLKHHFKHQTASGIRIQPWFENKDRLNEVLQMASKCHLLRFTGGEPTVNNNLLNFLTELSKLNTDMEIEITTNGQTFNNKLIEILAKFRRVVIALSLDGFKEVQEYIRWPSSWKKIEQNLEQMIKLKNSTVKIYTTIQVLNVGEIDKLFDWALSKQVDWINAYPVWSPSHYRPSLASQERKDKFNQFIKKYKNIKNINYQSLLDVSKTFDVPYQQHELKLLKDTLNTLDKVRNTSYKNIMTFENDS